MAGCPDKTAAASLATVMTSQVLTRNLEKSPTESSVSECRREKTGREIGNADGGISKYYATGVKFPWTHHKGNLILAECAGGGNLWWEGGILIFRSEAKMATNGDKWKQMAHPLQSVCIVPPWPQSQSALPQYLMLSCSRFQSIYLKSHDIFFGRRLQVYLLASRNG